MNNIEEGKKFHHCTSCQMCSAICPTNAIEIQLNKEGFYRPVVHQDKCIHCGLCQNVCYQYDGAIKVEDCIDSAYAAWAKDKQLLKQTTSGAIAAILAQQCLKQGYYVAGVSYDYTKNIATSVLIKTEEDLEKIKGSKYIQSYTKEAFQQIIQDTSEQKYVIFGLPCHIYAFSKMAEIKKQRSKYILIDLFCHGCPTMNLWKKYITKVKKDKRLNKVDEVEFRAKDKGWHEFCIKIQENQKKYLDHKTNPFYTLFFSNLILNECCVDCKLRSTLAYTDIRLGDFWGEKYDTNVEGVSAVAICTESGKTIWQSILQDIHFEPQDLQAIIKNQSYGDVYEIDKKVREKLLGLLADDEQDLKVAKKYYCSTLSRKQKWKGKVKLVISFLPKGVKNKIRKSYHRKKQ